MSYTFAIGPVLLDEDGELLRKRFAMRLVTLLRAPVRVIASKSYAEVGERLASGEASLAWLPPAVFVRLEESNSLSPLVRVQREGGDGYRGVLFVPADSDAKTPEDLAGARMAWVDPDSCGGHLFVRLALKERGLDPDTLFSQQRFAGSHGSAVRAVLRGEADAGATHAHTLDDGETLMIAGWQPYAGKDGMRPLLVSSPIPTDVICATDSLGADALDEVREALLRVHEGDGAELLDEIFGGDRLVPTHTVDYDAVRAAMK